MDKERHFSLSQFEGILHRKHKKVTLGLEIEDCFKYFNEHTSKLPGDLPIVLIHGNGIEIRKVEKGRGYSIETDGIVRTVGVDTIPKSEQIEMVRRIRNITFPYAEHIKLKKK